MSILTRKTRPEPRTAVEVFDAKFTALKSMGFNDERATYGAYAEAEWNWIKAHPLYDPLPRACCHCGRAGDLNSISALGSGILAHSECVAEVWELYHREARAGLAGEGLAVSSLTIDAVKGPLP